MLSILHWLALHSTTQQYLQYSTKRFITKWRTHGYLRRNGYSAARPRECCICAAAAPVWNTRLLDPETAPPLVSRTYYNKFIIKYPPQMQVLHLHVPLKGSDYNRGIPQSVVHSTSWIQVYMRGWWNALFTYISLKWRWAVAIKTQENKMLQNLTNLRRCFWKLSKSHSSLVQLLCTTHCTVAIVCWCIKRPCIAK